MVESTEVNKGEEPTTVDSEEMTELAQVEVLLEDEAASADEGPDAASALDTDTEVAASDEGGEEPGQAVEEAEEEPERPEGVAWFVVHS
jgi:hypothetical protein